MKRFAGVAMLLGMAAAQGPATALTASLRVIVTPNDGQLKPLISGTTQGRAVVHVYVALGNIYSGYDVVMEPQTDPTQTRASFRRLSLSPEVLGLNAAATFAEPLRYPDARVVGAGEAVLIDPMLHLEGHDVSAGVVFNSPRPVTITEEEWRARQIMDHMMIPGARISAPTFTATVDVGAELAKLRYRRLCEESWAERFSVEGSALCIVRPRVLVDGVVQGQLISGESQRRVTEMLASGGNSHWFYVPRGGRYVYSLTRAPGLEEAGEVAGLAMTLTVGGKQVVLESALPMTPGGDRYPVYARHEADWQPASDLDLDRMILGTLP